MTAARKRLAAWRAYWFRPAPLVDLGVSRIVLAAIVLVLDGRMRFWAVGLAPPELWQPLPWIAALGLEQPSLREIVVLGSITRGLFVAVLVGIATPVVLPLAFLLQFFQEALLNCFGKVTHGTIPLLYALFFFALSPCGRAVSVDAWLRRRWNRM